MSIINTTHKSKGKTQYDADGKRRGGVESVVVVFDRKTKTLVSPGTLMSEGGAPAVSSTSPPPKVPSSSTADDEVEDDGDSVDDVEQQHNDMCEVCNQGGELLCCDTCSLVFHPNCCRPQLATIPKEDEAWSCAYCAVDGTVTHEDVGYSLEEAKAHVEEMKALGVARHFRGVVNKGKKFRAQIQINGKQINLGKFETPLEAARKYDEHARKAFGARAKLNFPNPGELSHFESPDDVPEVVDESVAPPSTDEKTSSKRRRTAANVASSDPEDEEAESEADDAERQRYGNSADHFLFSLDSSGVDGCSALLSSMATDADAAAPHHTRHKHQRRPVSDWPVRDRSRDKPRTQPRDRRDNEAGEKAESSLGTRKRDRQKKGKGSKQGRARSGGSSAVHSSGPGASEPGAVSIEASCSDNNAGDVPCDELIRGGVEISDPLKLVLETTSIINLLRTRPLGECFFFFFSFLFFSFLFVAPSFLTHHEKIGAGGGGVGLGICRTD